MRYLFQRLLQGIWVIWGIVTLLFIMFFALGDPIDYLVADNADEATRAAIRIRYGLDQPLPVRYLGYLHRLSPLGMIPADDPDMIWPLIPAGDTYLAVKIPDLGRSFQGNAPVSRMIGTRLEGTWYLAWVSILLAGLIGISLGVIAALRPDAWLDRVILSVSVLGISAPSFFVGVLVAWLFAVVLRPLTGLDVSGYMFEEDLFTPGRHLVLRHLILPALALGIRPLAIFVQLTRSSMLEVLRADFVRTAYAKGLSPRLVVIRHALRNALNPVLTAVTGWLASLLAGAFFVEYIFNWQGIGKLTLDALETQDFPVITGCALTIGAIFVGVNMVTDLLYAVLDPRVRLR
ncbi:MAG: ABC transporter permease [Bacteroidia bacterium]|nr:ABC transporter permease [Bacteroidia bacterium]